MRNFRVRFSFSPVMLCVGIVVALATTYIGLIAAVMSYARLTMEFSQSVKNDEAVVAVLENRYLAAVARITSTDYVAAGYVTPRREIFIPAQNVTALR